MIKIFSSNIFQIILNTLILFIKIVLIANKFQAKRNLNLHVVSESAAGNLERTNKTIKNNLKTWINSYRMINDTIDILDARIINIGVNFLIAAQPNVDKFQVLDRA